MSNPRKIRNRKIASPPRLEPLSFSYFTRPGEERKLGLIDLLDKHFRDRDTMAISEISEGKPWACWFYNLINEAFVSAEVELQFNRIKRGPSLDERATILRGIEADISAMLENLSGESDPESQNSARVSDAFWHYLTLSADDEFGPRDAFVALLKFRTMLQGAVLAMEKQKKQTTKNQLARGRPRNIHKDILFRELMEVWKTVTGETPTLKVNDEWYADCRFCQFFEGYFGSEGPSAESIAAYCARLPMPGA